MLYAFSENFVLPLSHDEVVHGKRSLLGRMPGDRWQQFANLRLYLTYMYAHPGKKLLFMGGEYGQTDEWRHDEQLQWKSLLDPLHAGIQKLVKDLNHLYRDQPALHQIDCEQEGFGWIDCSDKDQSIISFVRRARDPNDFVIFVCNFTPVVRNHYALGVPKPGTYEEIFNSDSSHYEGSNVGNATAVDAFVNPRHGQPCSLELTIPPLASLILRPRSPVSG